MSRASHQQTSAQLQIRDQVERLPASQIRQIANASLGLEGIIPLWFGEPDLPTPDFITAAGVQAMRQGCTFYTHNRGIPELRTALSEYLSRQHKTLVDSDRITVTASACVAINLIQQVLTEPGTNIVAVTPLWPNLIESVHIMGGETRLVPLSFGADAWTLDLERLFAQVDGQTIAILINSPNNPTGWVMQQQDQKAVLDFCRRRGLWLISDEVYHRLVYDQPIAPSVLDIADPDDKLIVVNSFSKSWAMSGWRLGWLTTPAAFGPVLEKVIEFHYSCPAHFSQVAGVTAVTEGEDFIQNAVARYRQARDLCIGRLQAMPRVQVHQPAGTFYTFFAVDGMSDSVAGCQQILLETRVGLAPGSAFGEAGEGFIRLCFANSTEVLTTALDRLRPFLD